MFTVWKQYTRLSLLVLHRKTMSSVDSKPLHGLIQRVDKWRIVLVVVCLFRYIKLQLFVSYHNLCCSIPLTPEPMFNTLCLAAVCTIDSYSKLCMECEQYRLRLTSNG